MINEQPPRRDTFFYRNLGSRADYIRPGSYTILEADDSIPPETEKRYAVDAVVKNMVVEESPGISFLIELSLGISKKNLLASPRSDELPDEVYIKIDASAVDLRNSPELFAALRTVRLGDLVRADISKNANGIFSLNGITTYDV